MTKIKVTVVGAGVLGLWQALALAKLGHAVTLVEQSEVAFATAASRWAGAMLAPDCEAESAPEIVRDLGQASYDLWHSVYDGVARNGTLVTASARDLSELDRFARATRQHERLGEAAIGSLEPDLAGRFASALFFPHEAHFDCIAGMSAVLGAARVAGVTVEFGTHWTRETRRADLVIDCRGLSARDAVQGLRGVRGERVLVKSREVTLARPVRLLHPRQPIYVVPQGDGRFVVGATVIEREDDGPMTMRSALELLGSAYALHPAFAEAAILDIGAGVRPAFADNVPRILIEDGGRTIRVNGAYRHGFLLSPILAAAVAAFVAEGRRDHPLIA
ncbi:MAG: FAD-dependent oxidoreductase [Hyphomicrobium sp.]